MYIKHNIWYLHPCLFCGSVICQSVKYSTSIRTLDFSGCNVTWRGAEHMANIVKVEYLCWFYNACNNSLPSLMCIIMNYKLYLLALLSIKECRGMEQHGLSRWGIVSHSLKVWEVYAVSPSTATFWSETEVLLHLRMNYRRTSGLKVSRCQLFRDLPWKTLFPFSFL